MQNKSNFIVLDTEDNSKGKVLLINFYDGESHFTFKDCKKAIQWLIDKKGNYTVWAVNMAYDINNLFRDDFHLLEMTCVGSRLISAKFLDTNIYFKDTLNHWKLSVEKMGERIGLEKLKVKNNDFNDIEYCRRDCEIAFKFIKSMEIKYKSIGAKLKSTIGSTALTCFLDNYACDHTKQGAKFNVKQLEFFKKGYCGGRTEVFFNKKIEGKIFYHDFNSLYPSVMIENKFPPIKGIQYTGKNPDLQAEGVIHARVICPDNISVPYLYYRNDNNRIIYPIGTFTGHYTFFEIREAIKLGYKIEKIFWSYQTVKSNMQPFIEFVTDFYGKRIEAQKEKDTFLSDSLKLILNNLYGKFGQGNTYNKMFKIKNKSELKVNDQLLDNGMVTREVVQNYPKHSNMIWAALITAYGRHKLWCAMDKVIKSGATLIYCDTDSVIYKNKKNLFDDSSKLGELKLEGVFKYAHFKLPKMYKLINAENIIKYKAKGIPNKDNNQKEFFETGKTKFQRPNKLKETLRRNMAPKNKNNKFIINYWQEMEKVSNKKYDKRIVLKSGATIPHKVNL